MKRILIFILIAVSYSIYSENWKIDDYKKFDEKTFRKNKSFNEKINFDNIDYPRLSACIFYATNEQRVKYNLSRVEFNIYLEKSASLHSKNMVENNFFSHNDSTNPKYATHKDRAFSAGIANPMIAENIAESFGIQYRAGANVFPVNMEKGDFSYTYNGSIIPNHTYLSFADQVIDQWMNSSGHRANILSYNALELGCGAYFYRDKKFYNMAKFTVTQNFQLYEKVKVK